MFLTELSTSFIIEYKIHFIQYHETLMSRSLSLETEDLDPRLKLCLCLLSAKEHDLFETWYAASGEHECQ